MISIEAWRSCIGCHNIFSGRHVFKQDKPAKGGIATGAIFLRSSMGSTFKTAKLIGILLLIGCVESNPGPNSGGADGKTDIFCTNI